MRGEQHNVIAVPACASGSSPRAWGTVHHPGFRSRYRRFIPTCVGNRRALRPTPAPRPVHPHVRGEQDIRIAWRCQNRGSSPRAWGTACLSGIDIVDMRFIPTCLGNSTTRSVRPVCRAGHPHVRGAQILSWICSNGICGSSPRAWGTAAHLTQSGPYERFIPTCVGNRGLC